MTDRVKISSGTVTLDGELSIPQEARGLVLFAHGSGSSRHSPRNHFVARELQDQGLGTLLLDLLSENEAGIDDHADIRFDVALLAERLARVTDWLTQSPRTASLAIGYFGASTGAAAALIAAAQRPRDVTAVVCRGGRPDLAAAHLPHVHAPTLLIVGERDDVVLGLNRHALVRLGGPRDLAVVSAAGHLFEEPGALADVAELAGGWFSRHLVHARQDFGVSPSPLH